MKRLRDVAVRMRPPAPGASREDASREEAEIPVPGRTPFVPSSRDLAKGAAADAAGSHDSPPRSQSKRQIWDLEDEEPAPDRGSDAPTDPRRDVATPGGSGSEDMASRARRALAAAERQGEAGQVVSPAAQSSGRSDAAKTRVLGFRAPELETDPISAVAHKTAPEVRYPAGWLVVVEGPGRGAFFAVTTSVSSIGRGADQAISLNFGDASISRQNHAAIAYDAEQNRFFLGHGNKSNIVRRNGQPVLATEELFDGDEIRIGKTSLRFVALCGEAFTWGEIGEEDESGHE